MVTPQQQNAADIAPGEGAGAGIPMDPASTDRVEGGETLPEETEQREISLLIIDDDDNLGDFLGRLLGRVGYRVTAAQTGDHGLELAREGSYDLALLDIEMPDMSGFEVCRRLKLMPGWDAIPVLMLSGNRSKTAKEHGFALGIADYISKPFDITELRARIQVHLRNKLWHDRMNHESLEVRREAQESLREIRERFMAMAESSFDLICELDEAGVITFASPASTDILGKTPEQLVGTKAAALLPLQEQSRALRLMKETLQQDKANRFLYKFTRRDGTARWLEVTARSYPTTFGMHRLILVARDTTDRKIAEDALRHQATHDLLTGLPNRLQFISTLDKMLAGGEQSARGTMVFLNLDYFKVINNTIGHQAADLVLVNVVTLLKTTLRPGELLARFIGGDEFAILWPDTVGQDAEARVAGMLRLLASLKCGGPQDPMLHVSACAGLVPVAPYQSSRDIVSHAASACYSAKRRGRLQQSWYVRTDDDLDMMTDDVRWSTRMELALSERTFVLHYQPIMSRNGTVAFHEALLRWPVEDGTWISPGSFMPVAERVGLIEKIDEYVLEAAADALHNLPNLVLSINLSGKSVRRNDLVDVIRKLLAPYASRVIFEITETAAVTQLGQARALMQALQAHGFRFALDDFGTGYSSLAYLRDLPANMLKFDGSFVKDLATQPFNRALLRSLTEIAHQLGQETVAEHVETAEQFELIRELGIDYAQGYYFGGAKRLDDHPGLSAGSAAEANSAQ